MAERTAGTQTRLSGWQRGLFVGTDGLRDGQSAWRRFFAGDGCSWGQALKEWFVWREGIRQEVELAD